MSDDERTSGPKLLVVNGPEAAAARFMANLAQDGMLTFALDTRSDAVPVPWRSARQLLGALSDQFGAEALKTAIAPHRAELATILRGLLGELDADEHVRRIDNGGALLGRLPSSRPLHLGSFGEALASVFVSLLGSRPVRLLIANAAELDVETWNMLSPLLRRHGSLTLVIGRDPEYVCKTAVKARAAVVGAREVTVLMALRQVQVSEHAADADAAALDTNVAATAHGLRLSALDDGLEFRAAELLAGDAALSPDDVRLVESAIFAAADAMGFPAVISMVERLLQRGVPVSDEAELRFLAGVAADNLCGFAPRAADDHPLFAYATRQFERALPGLASSADRVFVMYRRGLSLARSNATLPEARVVLSAAFDEAHDLPAHCVLHRAYAHNGLAYVLFRQGETTRAHALCAAALECVEARTTAPEVEVGTAHFNLLVNMGRLAFMAGDRRQARARMEQALLRLDRIPRRKPYFSWFSTQVFLDDMRSAVSDLDQRLERVLPMLAATATAAYAFWSADLHFRLGNADQAFERFRIAAEVWDHFHEDRTDVLHVQLNAAVAAFRAGKLTEAEARFGAAKLVVDDDDAALHAELDSALALIAAHAGRLEQTIAFVARAELALAAVDDRELSARVLRSIGDAALALGDRAAAREAYARGLGEHDGDSAPSLPEEDTLGLLLGLCEAGGATPARAARAFALAQPALLESNAWWDMPRLLALLRQPSLREAARQSCDLSALCTLTAQRADCAAVLRELDDATRGELRT